MTYAKLESLLDLFWHKFSGLVQNLVSVLSELNDWSDADHCVVGVVDFESVDVVIDVLNLLLKVLHVQIGSISLLQFCLPSIIRPFVDIE